MSHLLLKIDRIRPQHDYVLIERIDDSLTEGGIALPQKKNELSRVGRALRVGKGLWDVEGQDFAPVHTKRGDVVIFHEDSPDSIVVGTTHILVRDHCVVAALAEADEPDGMDADLDDLDEDDE